MSSWVELRAFGAVWTRLYCVYTSARAASTLRWLQYGDRFLPLRCAAPSTQNLSTCCARVSCILGHMYGVRGSATDTVTNKQRRQRTRTLAFSTIVAGSGIRSCSPQWNRQRSTRLKITVVTVAHGSAGATSSVQWHWRRSSESWSRADRPYYKVHQRLHGRTQWGIFRDLHPKIAMHCTSRGTGQQVRQVPSRVNLYVLNAVRCPYVRNAGRDQLSSEWRHNENDVTMIIAGLVADGTGRGNGDWRHAATGCNALVLYNLS